MDKLIAIKAAKPRQKVSCAAVSGKGEGCLCDLGPREADCSLEAWGQLLSLHDYAYLP